MRFLDTRQPARPLLIALVISLLAHVIALLIPIQPRAASEPRSSVLEARLAKLPLATPLAKATPEPAKATSKSTKSKPRQEKKILAVAKGRPDSPRVATQTWSAKEKANMDNFLNDLGHQPPPPTLAQRSLAMARNEARASGRQENADNEVVEAVPGGPPTDPFSLEMYLDAVVKKLNRSAAFVRNDPRSKGVRTALVRVKLNPSGTLRSFDILNAGDQKDEIAFVRSVVEQAVPFAAFPADLRKSALSLGMLICIRPSTLGDGGFGFSRDSGSRGC